ncbi:ATP-binding protein [Palleronia sp. LCG004]|uniref:ATP-binding protein n=1 Tax=Palleronia sp. LCG004 TaxID=3079304 RepID=UPI0029432367|nr:ATP-binding protein [Palleronia sp. LCG004]WOI55978.1 ATP-binding protein [Palleronia sp. LCG004]
MHRTPLVRQIERIQGDRPVRNVVAGVVILITQMLDPYIWGIYVLMAMIALDFGAWRLENRMLRGRSLAAYLSYCALCSIYTSLLAVLIFNMMASEEVVIFFTAQALLWTAMLHCAVLRTDKNLIGFSSAAPLLLCVFYTPVMLADFGTSRIELMSCAIVVLMTGTYVATIFRSAIRQKKDLTQAERTAHEALRTRERFFATIGHEIRTPLNGVLGIAQILEQEATLPAERERAKVLGMSCQNLNALVSDMLDHAKLTEGKFTIAPRPTVIHDLVSAVEGLYRDSARQAGLDLRTEFLGQNPDCVLVDPVRVRQILCNLVSNALKYTHEGEIVLTVSTQYRRQAPWLSIAVRDTGTGIRDDALATIFDPYRQLDDDPSKAGIGSGLGLMIARDLARAMGGDVSVMSRLGRGTKFTVEIPSPIAQFPRGSAETPDTLPDLTGRTIAIVDDAQVNRMIVRKFLEPTHATILEAEDGREALELLAGNRVDLAFIDMHMPNLNGLGMLEAMQADPHQSRIATVLMSAAYDSQESLFDAVLTKPVDRGELIALVERLLPEGPAVDDLRISA